MEIVDEDETGIFFEKQTPASLEDAIKRFFRVKWKKSLCITSAQRFSKDRFVKEFTNFIKEHGPTKQ